MSNEKAQDNHTTAERLRWLQRSRGIGIAEMASLSGLSKNSFQNYLRSKNPQKPGYDALVSICLGMEVSADWLLGLSDNPTRQVRASNIRLEDVEFASRIAVSQLLRSITQAHSVGAPNVVTGDGIMGATPDQMAADIAASAVSILTDSLALPARTNAIQADDAARSSVRDTPD